MREQTAVPELDREVTQLFADHGGVVRSFSLARCKNSSLADDITSEVFIAATKQIRKNSVNGIGAGWLITVAKRRLADHWRREGCRERLSQSLESQARVSLQWESLPEHSIDPEHDKLLAAIPVRQANAMSLRYIDGLSVGEVAVNLGLSYQGAESLLARGRRSLSSVLKAA